MKTGIDWTETYHGRHVGEPVRDPIVEQHAANQLKIGLMLIRWHADYVRTILGQAEVVEPDDWDDVESTDVRMFRCPAACAPYAHFHAIRDKAGMK